MKRKAYHVAFPVALVVVMVAFFSAVFLVDATPSLAAHGAKKSSAGAKVSAVDQAEARIKKLKAAIKITEAQEGLWNNLTQAMRDNAKNMDELTKDSAEKTKNMNAVEQMKFYSTVAEAHSERLKKFIPPFEELYASMSDEQKKNTDAIFRTGKHGKQRIR